MAATQKALVRTNPTVQGLVKGRKVSDPAGRAGDYVRVLKDDRSVVMVIARKKGARLQRLAADPPASLLKGLTVKKGKTGIAVELGEKDVAKGNKLIDWLLNAAKSKPKAERAEAIRRASFARGQDPRGGESPQPSGNRARARSRRLSAQVVA